MSVRMGEYRIGDKVIVATENGEIECRIHYKYANKMRYMVVYYDGKTPVYTTVNPEQLKEAT